MYSYTPDRNRFFHFSFYRLAFYYDIVCVRSVCCLLACLLKSVEFDDDVALILGDAGLDVGPHVAP